MSERPLVFISCGQYHDSEKALGKEIAQLANEMGLEGYFAENQNSVAALASNIFAKLNEAAAFVVVIHPRGTVQGLGGESHIRASVWIEQEIAIASSPLKQSAGTDWKFKHLFTKTLMECGRV